jgi:hypothetical protein
MISVRFFAGKRLGIAWSNLWRGDLWAVSLLLVVAGQGCKSPPIGGEGSLAWVEIAGHSSSEIAVATKEVLGKDGYRVIKGEGDEFTFEKPGSAWNEVTHGGFGEGMTVRMKVVIGPEHRNTHLLQCRVYLIRHAGDRVFEDSHEVTRFSRKPYQKLLEQVKATLESQP